MALYSVTCNNCGRSCNVPHYLMGKKLKCEHCHREFIAAEPAGRFGAAKAALCVGAVLAIGIGIAVIIRGKGNSSQTASIVNKVADTYAPKHGITAEASNSEADTTAARSKGFPQGYYKTGLIELKSAPVKSGTEQPDEMDEKTEAAIEKGITPKIHDGYLRFSPKMERY